MACSPPGATPRTAAPPPLPGIHAVQALHPEYTKCVCKSISKAQTSQKKDGQGWCPHSRRRLNSQEVCQSVPLHKPPEKREQNPTRKLLHTHQKGQKRRRQGRGMRELNGPERHLTALGQLHGGLSCRPQSLSWVCLQPKCTLRSNGPALWQHSRCSDWELPKCSRRRVGA